MRTGAGGPEPRADVVATLGLGNAFSFSTPIAKAGAWRILVPNERPRRDAFTITRVLPGYTVGDALAWRRSDGGPPMTEPWGGVVAVPAGESMLTTIDLIPGTYVANGVSFVVAE